LLNTALKKSDSLVLKRKRNHYILWLGVKSKIYIVYAALTEKEYSAKIGGVDERKKLIQDVTKKGECTHD